MARDTIKLNDHGVGIDIAKMIPSKVFIYANSGYGKSHTIRRIIEQSAGKIQQIIIDTEGEFSTLREKFDFVLIGKGLDIEPDPKTAALMAHKLLEKKVSAIIDIYELDPVDRERFVKNFTDALTNAPKNLWHPAEIIYDEAQDYAPERPLTSEQFACAASIVRFAKKGRKRGFCPIFATQRISDMSKSVIATCNNKLIGQASLDTDMKRAAAELGFSTKEQVLGMRDLDPGEFYVFGPAIGKEIQKIKVGPVLTTHPDSSKVGSRIGKKIPPASEKVKKALKDLADLPQLAAAEASTIAEYKAKIKDLEGKLRVAGKPQIEHVVADPKAIERAVAAAIAKRDREWKAKLEPINKELRELGGILERGRKAVALIPQTLPVFSYPDAPVPEKTIATPPPAPVRPESPKVERPAATVSTDGQSGDIRPGARKILEALACRAPERLTKAQTGLFSIFNPDGGSFTSYISELRRGGFIDQEGDSLFATAAGIDAAGSIAAPAIEDIVSAWKAKLRPGEVRMIESLIEVQDWISKPELGDRCGSSANGGSFSSYLSVLRRNNLADVEKDRVRLSQYLIH